MSARKFCIFLIILVQMVAVLSPTRAVASDGESEAALAISAAEDTMASAYQAVKDAERAGAEVSGFSELLKDAAQLLAQAHTSFRVGDFDSAVLFADLSGEIGREIEATAYQLRASQTGLPVWRLWLTMVKSLLAVFVVFFVSLWVWSVFKRLYYRRMSAMKPEVSRDES